MNVFRCVDSAIATFLRNRSYHTFTRCLRFMQMVNIWNKMLQKFVSWLLELRAVSYPLIRILFVTKAVFPMFAWSILGCLRAKKREMRNKFLEMRRTTIFVLFDALKIAIVNSNC